jgi:hypothetical protein
VRRCSFRSFAATTSQCTAFTDGYVLKDGLDKQKLRQLETFGACNIDSGSSSSCIGVYVLTDLLDRWRLTRQLGWHMCERERYLQHFNSMLYVYPVQCPGFPDQANYSRRLGMAHSGRRVATPDASLSSCSCLGIKFATHLLSYMCSTWYTCCMTGHCVEPPQVARLKQRRLFPRRRACPEGSSTPPGLMGRDNKSSKVLDIRYTQRYYVASLQLTNLPTPGLSTSAEARGWRPSGSISTPPGLIPALVFENTIMYKLLLPMVWGAARSTPQQHQRPWPPQEGAH